MRMIAGILLAVVACKAEGTPPPPPPPTIAPAPTPSGELATMMPKIESAKILATKSPNETYALETWCLDEADAVARVTAALERDGWAGVRTRGAASSKLAIAAIKGDVRFSGQVTRADDRCAGTSITATVMKLGKLDEKPKR